MYYDSIQTWLLIGVGMCGGLLLALAWAIGVEIWRWLWQAWIDEGNDWKCEGWKEDPRL
jgi:hypothetical protein